MGEPSSSSINTLIGTFSAIGSVTSRNIVASNLICIDTYNNRIGINTLDPSYSITIVDNVSTDDIPSIGIYTPRLYFDLVNLPTSPTGLAIGQVYRDVDVLKVKLP